MYDQDPDLPQIYSLTNEDLDRLRTLLELWFAATFPNLEAGATIRLDEDSANQLQGILDTYEGVMEGTFAWHVPH